MKKFLLAAATLAAASAAQAGVITEVENNDTFATANSLDGAFTLESNENIANSTSIPHVTVMASSEQGGRDTFKFTVGTAGSIGIFDIDFGFDAVQESGFDAYLSLFNSQGVLLAGNDDNDPGLGGGGSNHGLDSYLSYTFATTGTYYVQVGSCCSNQPFNNTFGAAKNYQLQVSLQNPVNAVPEPAMLGLFGLGAIGLGLARRRRA